MKNVDQKICGKQNWLYAYKSVTNVSTDDMRRPSNSEPRFNDILTRCRRGRQTGSFVIASADRDWHFKQAPQGITRDGVETYAICCQ